MPHARAACSTKQNTRVKKTRWWWKVKREKEKLPASSKKAVSKEGFERKCFVFKTCAFDVLEMLKWCEKLENCPFLWWLASKSYCLKLRCLKAHSVRSVLFLWMRCVLQSLRAKVVCTVFRKGRLQRNLIRCVFNIIYNGMQHDGKVWLCKLYLNL